ncbi:unnamed protein product [Rotaria sordida]|uniref:Uncharacterized protein n=1 Tax=Rotaria sordida TaxID=392033 RepID=A0A814BL70_9BILA|nr:unnamed protein product [Rotaria sordida]CAF1294274.1 unnamed protein product [Rotaria sordida]
MAESIKNSENNLSKIYSSSSNQHLLFAETLRDWRDPLFHGHDPIPVPLCPRCAVCKCESLKDFRNTSSSSIHHYDHHHHHHKHDPSCPNFRHQHERAKTPSQQRPITKSKRRAISHDPLLTVLNTSSIIKSKSSEYSPLIQTIERKKSSSKIPVRISTSTNNYSPSPSPSSSLLLINKSQSLNKKTKIPRLVLASSLSSSTKTTDDLYEIDSLNDDADGTSEIISDNENISLKETNNMDEQLLIKKKKKHKHNLSIPDKRQRQSRYKEKEGRHSKSKSTSSSLSSSSQSLSPLRKKSHSLRHRRSSNSQILSSLSSLNTSEKLQSKQYFQIHPHSTVVSTDQSNHLSSQTPSLLSSSSSSSIYLIQVANQTNSFGLTKTIPYVWKNTNIENEENKFYPNFSIEQIPPIINNNNNNNNNNNKRSIPISSRNIILQRGQIDYWQNFQTSSDSILTSSCQNLTGSASHLLCSSSLIQQTKTNKNSHGNIISITTTKRYQPSLLNKTKYIQWNIEGNGKQLRYSKIKWHSDQQLHKHNRLKKKSQKKSIINNHTDTGGSSSEQNNQSAPLILYHENNTNLLNETPEVLEKPSMNTNSKQIDSIVPDYSLSHSDKNNKTSLSEISNEKIIHSSSTSPTKSKQILYASTDEDVDEINSHYFEDIDRSITTTIEDYREKLNIRLLSLNNEQNSNQLNSIYRPRILSTECSQITIDSGVDIGSEQKIYQPNITLTIDEQITDHNDLFALLDDSLIGKESKNFLLNQSIIENNEHTTTTSINKTEQNIYCSMKNNLNNKQDLYKSYELETISDEDEDNYIKEKNSNELIITLDNSLLKNSLSSIPPLFEFKLPTFGEWIDRAFTTFLSNTNQNQSESILSSRSSSNLSMHTSQSTINTSSSSQVITVRDNFNLQNISQDENSDFHQTQTFIHDDEHSLNDMSSSSLNCEKVDFDTYIINSNYEKINPSIIYEQNEIPFINERSKSLLSSITSSIENDGQGGHIFLRKVMNNKRRMPNYDDDNDDDEKISKKISTTINPNDLSSYTIYEKFQYSSNSHDSLNQSDHHIDTTTSSIDDLTKTNQFLTSIFHSKDSALGLSDDNLNNLQTNQLIIFDDNHNNNNNNNNNISSLFKDTTIDHIEIPIDALTNVNIETTQKTDAMISINNEIQLDEYKNTIERTISTSSSEQLIPKEKQTGMYYKAFGSSATINLTEQYNCEWLPQEKSSSTTIEKSFEIDNNNHVRIVHQSQIIGDNEDEFYYSPQTTFHACHSCPNLNSNLINFPLRERSYSLTTLDAYTHLNITYDILEQIWHSLLNVTFSDKDDNELNEYKLRHIIGLSNSYTNINHSSIEKSHSHNDIFSIMNKTNQKSITKIKSKSFDITSLMKQPISTSSINNSVNIGLLQGADISEPFADRLISISIQSDLESMQSLEHEQISNENSLTSSLPKESLNYIFNFTNQIDNNNNDDDYDEYDDLEPTIEIENKPLNIAVTFNDNDDNEENILPIVQIHDTYTELSLFRPHSLSTIPSSRASQYASSVDSDDIFEHGHHLNKENSDDNYQNHISDDDHGVIGSDFSSPQSRPLSSIKSQPLSPEQNQEFKSVNFSDIDHDAWERCIDEPIFYDDLCLDYKNEEELLSINQLSNNLITIVPLESLNHKETYVTDQIEPTISLINEHEEKNLDSDNFIENNDQNKQHEIIEQDYLLIEQQSNIYLDPNELVHRLEQLDLSNKQEIIPNLNFINNQQENFKSNIEHLTSIINDIHQINHTKITSMKKLVLHEPLNIEQQYSSTTTTKPIRYQNHSIDKVSDLEIVKQGKGFKIGYIDRQGTDQRVILTKRIETGTDIKERDPHIRLPHKERRLLNQTFSSVLYTNGNNTIQEDKTFQHSANDIEVPTIGTNPKHFDESDMISIDIDGPSTMLSSICESIVITQGSVYTNNSSKSQCDNSKIQSICDSSSLPISNEFEEYHMQTSHALKNDKIQVFNSWHDHTIINGSSTSWRSPFKPIKHVQQSINNSPLHHIEYNSFDSNRQQKSTRDISLSPITLPFEKHFQTISTSPITIRQTVDQSCQYSPQLITHDQNLQCCLEKRTTYTQVSSYEIPGFLQTQDGIQTTDNFHSRTILIHPTTLERSSDSGILVDDNNRIKSNLALQIDMKSSSSDSEDISELTTRSIIRHTTLNNNNNNNNIIFENPTIINSNLKISTNNIEQEILQLRRERAHILDLLSLNWTRSNIWVELTEAKLNYIIGETDALLRSLSFDSTTIDNETVKLKMHQYEEEMTQLTRQHLAVYRERLEDSKKQLDIKIDELELKKSSIENHTINQVSTYEYTPRSINNNNNNNNKRLKSFLSTSAENLTLTPIHDTIARHPHLLDVSFLTSTPLKITDHQTHSSNYQENNNETIRKNYRTKTTFCPISTTNHQYDYSTKINNQNNGNLSNMEGLSKSQQAILDETDKLVKDSQQLHTESASQFERAREIHKFFFLLLYVCKISETPIRLARANMAASRLSPRLENKTYISNNVTLAELFKYEQSLTKEATKNHRNIYSNTKTTSES